MAKKIEPTAKITPQDIENKLQALQGEMQSRVGEKKTSIATVAAGGGLVLMVIFFLLGRRSGKRRSAIVEIRRV